MGRTIHPPVHVNQARPGIHRQMLMVGEGRDLRVAVRRAGLGAEGA